MYHSQFLVPRLSTTINRSATGEGDVRSAKKPECVLGLVGEVKRVLYIRTPHISIKNHSSIVKSSQHTPAQYLMLSLILMAPSRF
jgi:hypothetical protein